MDNPLHNIQSHFRQKQKHQRHGARPVRVRGAACAARLSSPPSSSPIAKLKPPTSPQVFTATGGRLPPGGWGAEDLRADSYARRYGRPALRSVRHTDSRVFADREYRCNHCRLAFTSGQRPHRSRRARLTTCPPWSKPLSTLRKVAPGALCVRPVGVFISPEGLKAGRIHRAAATAGPAARHRAA